MLRQCSGRTPYQVGKQLTQAVTEKATNKGYIIGINDKSKLYQSARLIKSKTETVIHYPNHEGHWSANLPLDAVIGNERQ